MTCATIMTPHPKAVRDTDTILHAARELIAERATDIPVVDRDGKLAGLFGIYDLLALLVPRVAMVGDLAPNLRFLSDKSADLTAKFQSVSDHPVSRALNREPAYVHPDTPIVEAIRLFGRDHTTLPVVERKTDKLVGIVSYWDAARFIVGS